MTSASTRRAPSVARGTPRTPSHLHVSYIEPRTLQTLLDSATPELMAVVSFGQPLPYDVSCPVMAPDLPQIAGSPLIEVWTSARPVHTATDGRLSTAMNGEWLIGAFSLDEPPDQPLDALTYDAYRAILRRLNDSGYPHLCRIWNYFPRINDDQDGLERYRRFCVGRHQALAESLPGFPCSLPAATAVGTQSGPLQIMFLASTEPGDHLGNPRQMNAYEYPAEYGPRSPSFARATLFRSDQDNVLFIAGTASVVGHASRHIGRPADQTRESICNILTVLERAGAIGNTDFLDKASLAMYKAYVRDTGSLSEIRGALQRSPLSSRPLLFLQGDLCRKELLVEIEGLIFSE
ncbi:MAG: hypothetical protein NNA31_00650 [Nitrospira sp.]|nr:hypothetical protein [Nitrospira sp.]